MNPIWITRTLSPQEQQSSQLLHESLKINQILCDLLVQRGIDTFEKAKDFFRPTIEHIHDPFLMNDMHKAVDRLNEAIQNKEKVLIYGDYDVDGTTAVSLVYKFLHQFYTNIGYYIPDRYDEGYGVSYNSIDYAYENGYTIMIVLDCGIKATEKVKYAKEKGIGIIICDHHTPDATLPDAVAVLDAKRQDNTYPYRELSGCGVGFKFMQAFAIQNNISQESLLKQLDLLAVSIASDIVPILGENRALMHLGLKQLNTHPSLGLQAILDICKINSHQRDKDITTSDIVFKIGPRINAAGRIETGNEAVDLLVAKDYETAKQKGNEIEQYNHDRKELDKQTTLEAKQRVHKDPEFNQKHSIVVCDEGWSKGVIGIVASRLSETFHKPSIVLTQSNKYMIGSARSIPGFDLYSAIESCRDILENFGGHKYAAGLTLLRENVAEFTERFDKFVGENLVTELKAPQINIDADIKIANITPSFINVLDQFEPYGPNNLKPIFRTGGLIDNGGSRLVGNDPKKLHLKLDIVEPSTGTVINAIGFGMGKPELLEHIQSKKQFSLCYTIEKNIFRGKAYTQLMIRDIQI